MATNRPKTGPLPPADGDTSRRSPVQPSRFIESLLEALPNPVFVKDEQHRWVLLNDSYCAFMGYTRDELIGKSDHDFFPPAEADVFWAKDDAVFTSRALNENEESFTDRAGRVHVILTRKTLHVDANGRRYLLGVITDITDRKAMEKELRRSRDELEVHVRERTEALEDANRRLQEEARRRSEFLAVLSHELRNPLASIDIAVHLLDRLPVGSAQAARAREVIGRQTEHLARLVDDLLDVTRISRGKIKLHREVLDLCEVVRQACEDHRPLFEQSGTDLHLDLPTDPVWCDVDRTRIGQVIGNLLHNASKFTPARGVVSVELRSCQRGSEIRVRDTGTGIDPAQLAHVFEAFMQEERSLARTRGGLGLGLGLAKGLVELHGGTIAARSEGVGRGAEFVVVLPLVTSARQVEPAPAGAERNVACGQHILIIEDNTDFALALSDALRLEGHEVRIARDGTTGIAMARERKPDVVLCDIGLPDVDGYEVARLLRADETLRRVRLVAVSGYAQPEDKQRAKEAGFDAHLAKPTPLAELNALLAC
jgi:PAS domain S-box-containing protein